MTLFKFANVTDSHLFGRDYTGPKPEKEIKYRKCLEEVLTKHADVDFFIHTGDMCTGGAPLEAHRRYKRIAEEVVLSAGKSIYFVRGNHDSFLNDNEYAEVYGPSHYWFSHKGWAFLCLDRYWKMFEQFPYAVDMSPESLAWVARLLKEIPKDMPMVLSMHENPVGISRFPKGEQLLAMLSDHRLVGMIFGHVQCNYTSSFRGISFSTVVGEGVPFDGSPLSYQIAECDAAGGIRYQHYAYELECNLPREVSLPSTSVSLKPDTDWLTHRGPGGTRLAPVSLPRETPGVAWSIKLPGILSAGSLNVRNGIAYVGSKTDGSWESCCISAVEVATGKLVWQIQVDGSVEGGVALDGESGYFGTSSGTVYRISLADGSIEWTWNNGENLPYASEPYIDGDNLYIGANWEVYALNKHKGDIVWRRLITYTGTSYFCPGYSSPIVVDGRVFHSRPFNGNPIAVNLPNSSSEDRDAWHSLLQSCNADNGRDLRHSERETMCFAGYRHASPIYYKELVYMAGYGLYGYRPDDLSKAVKGERFHQCSATPTANDHYIFVAHHGGVAAYDVDGDGYRKVWYRKFNQAYYLFRGHEFKDAGYHGHACFAAPLSDDQTVISADCSGDLQAYHAEDGAELWRLNLGQPLLSALTVSGNVLLVGAFDGTLRALAW